MVVSLGKSRETVGEMWSYLGNKTKTRSNNTSLIPRHIVALRNIGGTIWEMKGGQVGRGFLMPSFCIRDRSVLG